MSYMRVAENGDNEQNKYDSLKERCKWARWRSGSGELLFESLPDYEAEE
jgi:hypothetical protein